MNLIKQRHTQHLFTLKMASLENKIPNKRLGDGYSGGGIQDGALKGTDESLTKKPASLRMGDPSTKVQGFSGCGRWWEEAYRFRRSSLSLELVE